MATTAATGWFFSAQADAFGFVGSSGNKVPSREKDVSGSPSSKALHRLIVEFCRLRNNGSLTARCMERVEARAATAALSLAALASIMGRRVMAFSSELRFLVDLF